VAGNVNDMMVGNAITTCVSTTAFHWAILVYRNNANPFKIDDRIILYLSWNWTKNPPSSFVNLNGLVLFWLNYFLLQHTLRLLLQILTCPRTWMELSLVEWARCSPLFYLCFIEILICKYLGSLCLWHTWKDSILCILEPAICTFMWSIRPGIDCWDM
jgi:hypothetical protein